MHSCKGEKLCQFKLWVNLKDLLAIVKTSKTANPVGLKGRKRLGWEDWCGIAWWQNLVGWAWLGPRAWSQGRRNFPWVGGGAGRVLVPGLCYLQGISEVEGHVQLPVFLVFDPQNPYVTEVPIIKVYLEICCLRTALPLYPGHQARNSLQESSPDTLHRERIKFYLVWLWAQWGFRGVLHWVVCCCFFFKFQVY